jgi:hypothetical protein
LFPSDDDYGIANYEDNDNDEEENERESGVYGAAAEGTNNEYLDEYAQNAIPQERATRMQHQQGRPVAAARQPDTRNQRATRRTAPLAGAGNSTGSLAKAGAAFTPPAHPSPATVFATHPPGTTTTPQLQCGVSPTQMVPVGYSAIGETIAKMGSRTVNDERIKGELRWQQSLTNKRTEQKEFVHSALQLLGFLAFVFMIQGSGFVKMGHSQSKFTPMSSTTDELNGKIFGFLEDRREHVDPKIMEIPAKYFGQWHTVKALTNPAHMDTWYSGNISNRTTFWSGGTSKTNVTLPYILFLPTVAVKIFGLDRQSLTPFECYNII